MTFSKDTLQVLRIPIHEGFRDAQLEDAFTDFGPLKRCFVVRKKKKTDRFTIGYVQFAIEDDAAKCLEESGKKIKVEIGGEDSELGLRWAHQKGDAAAGDDEGGGDNKKRSIEQARFDQAAAKAKKARLIIRNLSFKAEEEDVRGHFSAIGEVKEVKILQKPDGKRVGCAFINFSTIAEAAKAIKKLNKSAIKGRPVAVDWALPKEEFQKGQKAPVVEEDEGSDSEAAENEPDKKLDEGEDEEDSESSDAEGDESEHDEEDSSDDDDDEEGEDDMGGSDDDETEGEKKGHDLKTGHDVAENKTVFVRNIAFNSDEEDLRDMMAENFGPVLFARLVMDKMTERPRGTGFVKFREPEGAEKAVAASESADGLWLDDRQIYACAALSKEDADTRQEEKKKKESKDSRNLHLAVEGLVRQGTQAAEGVSKSDLEKRARVEKWKRQMLKDLNAFISPTRLCFRNIPPSYNDAQLKKLVVKNVNKTAKITECKVIREMKGTGEGKGYGFLAFESHEDTLQCLRKLNNNPAIFGKINRPIVEFSIENRKAVNARVKRLEKSREKNPVFKGKAASNKEGGGGGSGGGQRGFKRKAEKDKIEDKPEYMGSVNNPKMRKMPSHTGPKVRHNPRISRRDIKKQDKERKNPKKRKRIEAERQQQQQHQEKSEPAAKVQKKKPQKKLSKAAKKDFKEEKNFTALVEKYKSKLNSASAIATKQKWFDA